MTNLEALSHLDTNCATCRKSTACEECYDGYEQLKEFCKKADKYLWHDLRENPADLPTENGQYLGVHYYYGRPTYKVVFFANDLNSIDECDFPKEDFKGVRGFYDKNEELGYCKTAWIEKWKEIEE